MYMDEIQYIYKPM